MACMRKAQTMASDETALYDSALLKFHEFRRQGYPVSVLAGVCSYMAATTSRYTWIRVRDELRETMG